MSVNKLLEVEEKVWSPMYGLKGNIDATVQVNIQTGDVQQNLTVPFELKTGKFANAAHKAQTALYTLLLSNRYGQSLRSTPIFQFSLLTFNRPQHSLRHIVLSRIYTDLPCIGNTP